MSTQRQTLFALLLAASLTPVSALAQETTIPALKAEATSLIQSYAGRMKAALTTAMTANGPLGALDVCHKEAPAIAADIAAASGWSVGRTSLKPRNDASAADTYEMKIMASFMARIAAGEKPEGLASAEIIEENGQKSFRFIKAIATAEQCLACHGESVAPDVKAKIGALYPNDQATGFKAGDMRGVFSLKKPLAH